ncbi:hypothetical protein ACFQ2B_12745 [Streptomyces stramineus]
MAVVTGRGDPQGAEAAALLADVRRLPAPARPPSPARPSASKRSPRRSGTISRRPGACSAASRS